jgi:hypothetical protein
VKNDDDEDGKDSIGTFVQDRSICEERTKQKRREGGGEKQNQLSSSSEQSSSAMMINRYPINIRSLLPTPFVKRGRWSLRIFLGCPSAAAAIAAAMSFAAALSGPPP